jgi:acyl carrier protein
MAKLVDDLKVDSLEMIEIIMDIEDTFDIEIADHEIDKNATIADLIKYVESKI